MHAYAPSTCCVLGNDAFSSMVQKIPGKIDLTISRKQDKGMNPLIAQASTHTSGYSAPSGLPFVPNENQTVHLYMQYHTVGLE